MANPSLLVCKDLLTYLQDLPVAILTSLYQHSAACLAVFRYTAVVRNFPCFLGWFLFDAHCCKLRVSWCCKTYRPLPQSSGSYQSFQDSMWCECFSWSSPSHS